MRELTDQDPTLANRPSEYVTYYACSGTPLTNAARGGHLEIVKLLVERGADPNLPEEGIAPRGHALYSAVYNGHIEVARVLLEHGAYPNVEVESSADTLSIAIMHDDQPMIRLLCSYGAARPVHLLAHYGDLQTAAAVFAVNPALADDPEALGSASGNEDFLRLMLRHAPDLPKRRSLAAGTRELTELLFQHGMDANRPDWLLYTPLHGFAAKGDIGNARIFLDHGADPNARDEDLCSTPLGYAARNGKALMVELLLRRGAKPKLPDDPPWATALAWATRKGHDQIVQMLTQFDKDGTLPAHSLESYERQAQDLTEAYATGSAAAIERLKTAFQLDRTPDRDEVRRQVRQRLGKPPDPTDPDEPLALADAQFAISLSHGFANWEQLKQFIEGTE